jgi:hypothetical protein
LWGFDSVFVINPRLANNKWDKSFCHQAVDEPHGFFAATEQSDFDIAIAVDALQAKDSKFPALKSHLPAYSSKIGNRVKALKTFGWTPLLRLCRNVFGHNLHLSVDCVLASLGSKRPSGANFLYQILAQRERISCG